MAPANKPLLKLTFVAIILFCASQARAQFFDSIKLALKDKDFVSLKSLIEGGWQHNPRVRWKTLRSIVDDYSEGVVDIEEIVPPTNGSNVNNYTIQLLATKNKIFYCKFTEVKFKNKGKDEWQSFEQTLDSFKDVIIYNNFEASFKNAYKDTLNHAELFNTDMVYGSGCGMVSEPPAGMEKLAALVRSNNLAELKRWLKSPNAEKQLYALTGYRYFTSNGYKLTADEKKEIALVKKKKGTVLSCSGCIFSDETIQQAIKDIYSAPLEYLIPGNPVSSLRATFYTPGTNAKFIAGAIVLLFLFLSTLLSLRLFNNRHTVLNISNRRPLNP